MKSPVGMVIVIHSSSILGGYMRDQYCCGRMLNWEKRNITNPHNLYAQCIICGKNFIAIPKFYYNMKYKNNINLNKERK